jgi:hypothetical protein
VTCPNSDFFLRESLAVTTDKVVQAYQVVSCQSGCNWNRAGAFIVMRKDHLLAAVRPTMDMFWLAPNQSDFMAVQMQSNFSDAYLVWLKVGDPSVTTLSPDRLGLLEILGLPYPDPAYSYRGTTTVWEKDFLMSQPMPPINIFPSQPSSFSGAPPSYLYASPTPITSAVYRQGQVDVAINDGCGPINCIRLMKISNFGYGTVVAKDSFSQYAPYNPVMNRQVPDLEKTIGLGGANLFDGSLAIDPYGDLFMSAAYSSSTRNPGIAVTGIRSPVSSTSTLMPVSPIVESPSNYVSCGTSSNNPWGAYMRSMPDPNNWTHVWVPGEVSLGSCDWATVIASVTMGIGPQAAKMSPTFGSIKGGQMVEIDGSFFVPNANQVLFGSTPGHGRCGVVDRYFRPRPARRGRPGRCHAADAGRRGEPGDLHLYHAGRRYYAAAVRVGPSLALAQIGDDDRPRSGVPRIWAVARVGAHQHHVEHVARDHGSAPGDVARHDDRHVAVGRD